MLLKKEKKAIQIIAEKDFLLFWYFLPSFPTLHLLQGNFILEAKWLHRSRQLLSNCYHFFFFFFNLFFPFFFSYLLSFGAKWYRLFICIFHFTFRAIVASAEAFHSTKIYNFTPASQQDSFYGQYLIVWWRFRFYSSVVMSVSVFSFIISFPCFIF